MNTHKTLTGLVVLAGIWEVVVPFLFGYTATTAFLWNAVVIGVALVILAGWAYLSSNENTARNLDWVNGAIGLWLIAAPFVLGYSGVAVPLWNDVIIGIIVAVASAWAALSLGQRQHPRAM